MRLKKANRLLRPYVNSLQGLTLMMRLKKANVVIRDIWPELNLFSL